MKILLTLARMKVEFVELFTILANSTRIMQFVKSNSKLLTLTRTMLSNEVLFYANGFALFKTLIFIRNNIYASKVIDHC